MFRVKRMYAGKSPEDGRRYLVDRMWPRGISKEKAGLDAWLKELAPSNALRTWFNHEPEKWEAFTARYRAELADPAVAPLLQRLRQEAAHGVVTLLYAAKDVERNNAVCLKEILEAEAP